MSSEPSTFAEAMAEQKKRDWVSMLAPTILGLAVSLSASLGSAAWYFGEVNTRLTAVEESQRNFASDRVTQRDLQQRDAAFQTYRQELDMRLNRMDDKLDKLLEYQTNKRP